MSDKAARRIRSAAETLRGALFMDVRTGRHGDMRKAMLDLVGLADQLDRAAAPSRIRRARR